MTIHRRSSFLGQLKRPEKFREWSFSIAINYLRKRWLAEKRVPLTFELMESDCRSTPVVAEYLVEEKERALYTAELKISCTHAMLHCLSEDERIAFVLSGMFSVKSGEGAAMVGMHAPAFRKRVSRAKQKLKRFMKDNCALLSDGAPCRCEKRIEYALSQGRIGRMKAQEVKGFDVETFVHEMNELESVSDVFKHNPDAIMDPALLMRIQGLMNF